MFKFFFNILQVIIIIITIIFIIILKLYMITIILEVKDFKILLADATVYISEPFPYYLI